MMAALSCVALARERTRPEAAAMLLLGTLPVFATRICVLILPREALFILPYWMLAMAAGVTQLPTRPLRWAAATALAGLALFGALRPRAPDEGVVTEQSRKWLDAHALPGELVVHAETHSLLFFMWHEPQFENRILEPAGQPAPFFEGGLVVPRSAYISRAEWSRRRAQARSWGVWVNRAVVSHSVITRAGADDAALFRMAAGDSAWSRGSVTVWAFAPLAHRH